VVLTNAAGIFLKDDIQMPVLLILNTPSDCRSGADEYNGPLGQLNSQIMN
jgi:hypothetical protein